MDFFLPFSSLYSQIMLKNDYFIGNNYLNLGLVDSTPPSPKRKENVFYNKDKTLFSV